LINSGKEKQIIFCDGSLAFRTLEYKLSKKDADTALQNRSVHWNNSELRLGALVLVA
jgi:hypothetical protein